MPILLSFLYAAAMFAGILFVMRLGRTAGHRQLEKDGEAAVSGLGAVDGAVFGLMGLLIAFTFNGAAQRFDGRRHLMTEQINAIGTAYLRLDLIADQTTRAELQDLFRQHVDRFLDVTESVSDPRDFQAAQARLEKVNREIWTKSASVAQTDRSQPLAVVLLPPVNQMLDLCNSSLLVRRQHPPLVIYLLLTVLVLASALLAGFDMGRANRLSPLHAVGFAAITSLAIYLTLDLEYPRLGLIQVGAYDQGLVELRATMN